METFEKFIAPLSTKEFLDNYWQITPLFLTRKDEIKDLISVDEIDAFLSSSSLSFPSVRIIGNGTALELETYKQNGKGVFNFLNKEKVFELFAQGNTIVIQGASFLFKKLGKFVQAIESETGMQVHPNIYITPSNSKGFNPHFDTHEVFVYQVSGSKSWNIYDMPVQAPIGTWHLTAQQTKQYLESEPDHKLELNEGNILYIPRGVVHDAFTNDEPSIHITFGFHPILKLDVLKQLISKAKKKSFFREAFFPGFDKTDMRNKRDTMVEAAGLLAQIIEDLPGGPNYSEKYFNSEGLFGSIYTIDKQTSVADFLKLNYKVNDAEDDNEESASILNEVSERVNSTGANDLTELKRTLKFLSHKRKLAVRRE